MELSWKNNGLVFDDDRICTNCCLAHVVAHGRVGQYPGAFVGLSPGGTSRWSLTGTYTAHHIFRTSAYIYVANGTSLARWTLSGVLYDTVATIPAKGIAVDSLANMYVAHDRSGGVSVTKYTSTGSATWTYDTGGNAVDCVLSADETRLAVCGELAGGKCLWVINASTGGLIWSWVNTPTVAASMYAVEMDSYGNVYVGNVYTYKVDRDGSATPVWYLFAGGAGGYYGLVTNNMHLYVAHSDEDKTMLNLQDGSDSGTWTGGTAGGGIGISCFDESGNLYDINGRYVQRRDPSTGDVVWTQGYSYAGTPVVLGPIHAGNKPSPLQWDEDECYEVGDIVTLGGWTYECIQAHCASLATQPGSGIDWEDYWQGPV